MRLITAETLEFSGVWIFHIAHNRCQIIIKFLILTSISGKLLTLVACVGTTARKRSELDTSPCNSNRLWYVTDIAKNVIYWGPLETGPIVYPVPPPM